MRDDLAAVRGAAALHLVDGAGEDPTPGTPGWSPPPAWAGTVSRILRLTHNDLTCIDGELHLQFGEPASPVPAPVAALLHEVIDNNEHRGRGCRWLFPGRIPDQPIAYRTLITALQRLGFPLRRRGPQRCANSSDKRPRRSLPPRSGVPPHHHHSAEQARRHPLEPLPHQPSLVR